MALCDTVTGGCALRRAGPPRVGPGGDRAAAPDEAARSVAPDVTLYLLRLVIGIA
jgi:hypothetical protein